MLADRRRIGNNALHPVLFFQNRRNLRNLVFVCVLIKQDKCVVFRKNIGNHVLLGQCIDGFRPVLQIACADKQQNEQYRDNAAEAVAETAQHRRKTFLMRFFRSLFLFGFFNRLMRQQYKRRQNGEHAQHAERNALCQYNTDVRTDFKAHKYQHQQSDDRGCGAARDRAEGGAQGVFHCLLTIVGFFQLLPVTVHQNYGIIHRQRELQHRRNTETDIRDFSEKEVCSEVQHNGNADCDKEQYRFKI